MHALLQEPIYRALSNSLSAAIDTGNREEVTLVLKDARNCLHAAQISVEHYADLVGDVQTALGGDYV